MSLVAIFFLAFGLSLDIFTVSLSSGLSSRKGRLLLALKLALIAGLFHFLMIEIGSFLGGNLKDLISAFDHWVAFTLLAFVGLKMIVESFNAEDVKYDMGSWGILLIVGLATSVDALGVGLSLPLIDIEVLKPAIIIAFTTALFGFVGVYIGKKGSKLFGDKVGVIGGIILIGIGIKILIEHLSY